MSFQAYIDNIYKQTGKTPEDFLALAKEKGYLKDGVKTSEIVAWLKKDYGLGQGHAMAIVLTFQNATQPKVSAQEQVDRLFKGDKTRWRAPYDRLISTINGFGPGVTVDATNTYISLLRQGRKFGIVQVTSKRLDIGIKLKGTGSSDRFEPAGDWNSMVTHRVSISDPKQIDAEVYTWLKKAYEAAGTKQPRGVAG